jgi:hypothetical protein
VAGRTPAEATRAFIYPLQQALSCIWTGHVSSKGRDPCILTLNGGHSIDVRCKDGSRIEIEVIIRFDHQKAEAEREP